MRWFWLVVFLQHLKYEDVPAYDYLELLFYDAVPKVTDHSVYFIPLIHPSCSYCLVSIIIARRNPAMWEICTTRATRFLG